MHHTSPSSAKPAKARRQPNHVMHTSVRGGVSAPPHRVHAHINDCAVTRSRAGSHALSMRVRLGKHPASPAPNANRIVTSDIAFHATPVSAVNADHASTICVSARRTPTRSPSSPMGISNSA